MNTIKRRRLSVICWESICITDINSKKLTLETVPPEVLEMILKYLPYNVISSKIRLVSRHFLSVTTSILNGAFVLAGYRLNSLINYTEKMLSIVKNNEELIIHTKMLNILELINNQYKLLRAVTWRYTHPPRPEKFTRLAFYAGSLLDQLYDIINLIKTKPISLITIFGEPDTRITKFFAMCKSFMNYFERVSERKLNRSALISGCKIVDILDVLAEGRQLIGFRLTPGRGNRGNVLYMQLRYIMKRTWFTCLKVKCPFDETSWREDQKFMYLRLRRLVNSVNKYYYQSVNFKRLLLLPSNPYILTTPISLTYSGYGEYGGRLYYYGNMNEYEYRDKFLTSTETEENNNSNNQNNQTTADKHTNIDLAITVELRCSPELAPWNVRSILKIDDFENRVLSHNPEIYLKMNITCPASIANRLPGHFTWKQRAFRRTNQ